jgi:hypothetical protein
VRWRKLGRIFDPARFTLPNGCTEFAQSPQALVFGDFVRIYFSTRSVDANGKYLSHVAFVDVKKNMRDIVGVSGHTVIELGELGCFDEHGIFPMNVLWRGDSVYGYTCGWSRGSPCPGNRTGSPSAATGDAPSSESEKGRSRGASLEPCLVAILRTDLRGPLSCGCLGTVGDSPRVGRRRHTRSGTRFQRGVRWTREEAGNVRTASARECQPSRHQIGRSYHMFFCYRQSHDFRTNRERGYRIGHAQSDDLLRWTRRDDDPGIDVTQGDWDSDMLCYPHVFECEGRVHLLYNGNEFGRDGFGLAVLE